MIYYWSTLNSYKKKKKNSYLRMESNRIEQMDIKKYIGENKYNEENY